MRVIKAESTEKESGMESHTSLEQQENEFKLTKSW